VTLRTMVLTDAAPQRRAARHRLRVEVDQGEMDDREVDVAASVAGGQLPLVDAHGMEPGSILKMLGSLGGQVAKLLVVACEPQSVDEGLGLSEPVRAALPGAIALVEQIIWSGRPSAVEVSR
jgi:hydrogenase maturation protease